ncbi:hypothetical protein F5884DRAFT_850989 [Xylogone sp. PMI_703]|nr:hypothetical protein F5884DRAFT_850989 [Xylogone sp. PMI_703]
MTTAILKKVICLLAVTSPLTFVSAFNVTYEGYFDQDCSFQVNRGNFLNTESCTGWDLWPVSSYKLYNTGPTDCPDGTTPTLTLYGEDGRLQNVCGLEPIAVIPAGEDTSCIVGLDVTPVSGNVACA